MKICLATGNNGKVAEMQALLQELQISLWTPAELGLDLRIPETGKSYPENAYLKSSAYAWRTRLPALADDSGLEVAALKGEPGLFSHRYAPGKDPSDADRRAYLLSQLSPYPRPWTAVFHCSVCLCLPNGRHWFFTGECPGEIVPVERGSNGFGYDPIFLVSGTRTTMAEMQDADKNRISHRARAVQAALPLLGRLASTVSAPR